MRVLDDDHAPDCDAALGGSGRGHCTCSHSQQSKHAERDCALGGCDQCVQDELHDAQAEVDRLRAALIDLLEERAATAIGPYGAATAQTGERSSDA